MTQTAMKARMDALIVYKKTVIVGKALRGGHFTRDCDVTVEIELRKRQDGGEGLCLSMCGIAKDSFGQWGRDLRSHMSTVSVSEEQIARMAEIWERWHLNDLQAGCEHQRAAGTHSAWMGDDYSGVHIGYPRCQVCGYSYGSAWLYEELPQEVIEEVKSW